MAGHMKSKEGKVEIVVFPIELYYIRLFFLCEYVCELNEIGMKGMRELLVPLRPCFQPIMHQRERMFNLTYLA